MIDRFNLILILILTDPQLLVVNPDKNVGRRVDLPDTLDSPNSMSLPPYFFVSSMLPSPAPQMGWREEIGW